MDARERRQILRRAALAVGIFAGLLATGVAAFMAVGDESFEEAFYRAFGAFTTANLVPEPDSTRERAISAVLTVAGGLFYLVLVGGVVQTLLRRAIRDVFTDRRMKARIADLDRHYVVCGYGRVGRAVTSELLKRGHDVVVVEQKPENWAVIERDKDFMKRLFLVKGDADNQQVLDEAGLERALGLVTCVGSDAENVYIALAARRCHPDVRIVARASDEDAEKNLAAATEILDRAITPYTSAGRDLAEAVIRVAEEGRR